MVIGLCCLPPFYDVFYEFWMCWSWDVTSFSWFNVMHSAMLVVNCMALTLTCMPLIFFVFIFMWFCLDSSLPWITLVQVCIWFQTLYWCILNRIHWSLCDNVATSFLNMMMSGLWWLYLPPWQSNNDVTFQGHTVCPELLSQCCCTSFCPNDALAGECNGSEDVVIWYFISMTAHVISSL